MEYNLLKCESKKIEQSIKNPYSEMLSQGTNP